MRRVSIVVAAAMAIALAGAGVRAQNATVEPVETVKQIMQTKIVPLSDAVFDAASEPPTTDAQWTALRAKALALAESGELLTIGPRVRDKGTWMQMAQQLVDAAVVVTKAAGAKDADALSAAGDALYETCASCHERYMNASVPEAK